MSEDISRASEGLRERRVADTSSTQRSSSMVPTSTNATSPVQADPTAWIPNVEVERQANELVVRVDLPGVPPDEIDIAIDDGLLTIAGERMQEQRSEDDGFIRTERSYGRFYRTIILPEGADESQIEAKVDNGVLEIDVPITGNNQARRIPVRS
jgi:HSP20 family protein